MAKILPTDAVAEETREAQKALRAKAGIMPSPAAIAKNLGLPRDVANTGLNYRCPDCDCTPVRIGPTAEERAGGGCFHPCHDSWRFMWGLPRTSPTGDSKGTSVA